MPISDIVEPMASWHIPRECPAALLISSFVSSQHRASTLWILSRAATQLVQQLSGAAGAGYPSNWMLAT
jgi:hypothetical protein